jgi:hypothetical protein
VTTPAIPTIKRGDLRYYQHPITAEKRIGVTSVCGMLPKPFLPRWSAKLVAEEAVATLGPVMSLVADGKRDAAIQMLKGAPWRSSGQAADTGTQLHAIAETINRGEDPGRIHPDLQASVGHYKQFLDDWQPEFLEIEATGWGPDEDGWAGTMDAVLKIGDQCLVWDLKTGKGVYEEVALQLTAYANARCLMEPDGTERPMPEVEGGLVLHLRPEGYRLIPIRIGPDIYEVFQSLLVVARWDSEMKKGVIGTPQKPNK